MKWVDKEFVENIINRIEWSQTHAQVPTILVKKDRIRVYFATRPQPDITLTSFCELDLNNFSKVIYVHDKPILSLGEPGYFDEHGIMPSSVIESEGIVYLYYSGWSRSVGVPYHNYTGLAKSLDGGITFEKVFRGPILERTRFELYSATSPEVLYNGNWHMWYCSGTNWLNVAGKMEHTYDIKYATSRDGLEWIQKNQIAISQNNKFEAITKPTVIEINGKFHMWYCYRGSINFRTGEDSYRIGYATSKDLINWVRRDEEAGIQLSNNGWDSEMNAYPAVMKIGDNIYMFYNGNSFGKYGFGYTKLKL